MEFAVANSIPEQFRLLPIREVVHAAPTPKYIELENELDQIRKVIFRIS